MDVATRLQPRTRAEAYTLERERSAVPEDSSTECKPRPTLEPLQFIRGASRHDRGVR
jgi:hypothetical protein